MTTHAPKPDNTTGGYKIAAADTLIQGKKSNQPTAPSDAELAAERDLADEPKTPIGLGAYQFISVRYDE